MYAICSMKRNQLTMCAEEVNVLAFTDHDTISAIAEAMESCYSILLESGSFQVSELSTLCIPR